MASPATTVSPASLAISPYAQSNPIDLTLDDDGDTPNDTRQTKRMRCEHKHPSSLSQGSEQFAPKNYATPQLSYNHSQTASKPGLHSIPSNTLALSPSRGIYRPAFAGPVPLPPISVPSPIPGTSGSQSSSSSTRSPPSATPGIGSSARQVIDLTSSPSPPPQAPPSFQPNMGGLPESLPPKTPVCIGQITVTALVLYPIPYLRPSNTDGISQEADWIPVRLQYEYTPNKAGGQETIHIKTPAMRTPMGEIASENFGVVEQKVASALGPMLGKGLIKLDAKVRRGMPNVPILPLQMLVSTPKGNIPVVGNYFHRNGLLLDHPTFPFDRQSLGSFPYYNPHNPPPGGFRNIFTNQRIGYAGPGGNNMGRWTTPAVSGKSVEVQRSQIDELFKSLKSGDELAETDPPAEIATKLYPHQKKALTFLLEREQERLCPDGKSSSLWQERMNPISGQTSWFHIVTQKEVFEKPVESKGAILADDMGLGKTITCVSLIASTLRSAHAFASSPLVPPKPPPVERGSSSNLTASHFAGSVWGMPETNPEACSSSSKGKGRATKDQDKAEAEYVRACRIKVRSRATLIICPLSTVANWEEQFREHWKGDVNVVGGAGTVCSVTAALQSQSLSSTGSDPPSVSQKLGRVREGKSIRVYVYHGNARRPDPTFLADFDAVITTYTTLASEFSKQTRSIATVDEDEDDESSDGLAEVDEMGNTIMKLSKPKKNGMKRKKPCGNGVEATSPLQSVYWFRVVLDEAHTIKETSTVGCRASCDLMADRRLCLTGTPVQNKLDDVYALIKFLRLAPFHDKLVWTEYIGTPVKFGQPLGVARLQTIMKCITLRRTKESKTQDGKRILSLPPRRDELRFLKFDEQEQAIYDQFFSESKAEFNELSNKNEVMKNYVGILQKILRLRQICDHYELVQLGSNDPQQGSTSGYDDAIAAICREGIDANRAAAVFTLLRESGTTQCVECGGELSVATESAQSEGLDADVAPVPKRGRKPKPCSRGPTRPSSPSGPRPIVTRCQHLFCFECYQSAVCPGWPNVPPDVLRSCSTCQAALSPRDAVEVSPYCTPPELVYKKKPMKRQKRPKDALLDNFRPSTKVKALLGDLIQFSKANPHSANYDPASVEIQMVDDQGNQLEDGVVKTIVFSQWTSMLDKVEDALEAAGIRYERLDGTMKRDDRTRAMEVLKHDPGCEVLLVSLKAGGVGLNLTAAQRVYLMDPYWNPAVENQAVDRIHRLGQTRPVTTVRLIIENTIEARLLEVQRKKTELANMTLGQNFSKAEMLQRRMEELNQLFKT
ncbi:hypothetical protein GLOTRDRAFT_113119 [Gloeophyllum trabeum ATCC 11539]|uniref:SNF2 family DNA-dependent ATPase domain-containing protein n=1 Tax=Gloeophyllum trabeum (strain ATCC 11539 / FP-39264 / Madison 617) TaxID=670483 RepID=S7S3V9_GLOTA|nr:uncharacterized protein GLOTRDRAFT_113119 [Gloeophyllum trabeum ATCC 11539]EPQ60504.1 hypothetical protein GLOTRDRAFT_113119 [Gloeophyllum trabeum ATCC 11539]